MLYNNFYQNFVSAIKNLLLNDARRFVFVVFFFSIFNFQICNSTYNGNSHNVENFFKHIFLSFFPPSYIHEVVEYQSKKNS